MKYSNTLQESWPADGQLKSHTKKCSELKNNMVGHTIFAVWPTCWLGPY